MPSRFQLSRARDRLTTGGVVAYPTEAVYGLGAHPLDADAVLRLLAIKRRSVDQGLILIACSFAQLEDFVFRPTAERWSQIAASWPGPVTWVLRAAADVPGYLTGFRSTLAVRVTAHPVAAALCAAAGSPLVSTSANRSGQRPARTPLEVRRRLGRDVDLILAGAVGPLPRPTPIRDGETGKLLRT